MRYTGPKNRIARRDGIDLGLKTPGSKTHARLLKRLNVLPGQHGTRKRRKVSEYATQLKEKQRLRFMFGITNKQLKKYFSIGSKKKGNTGLHLANYLEKRIDNIIYRLGFAPTRAAARQLVSHGHIKVNDSIVTTASFQVCVSDTVTFNKISSTKIPYIEQYLSNTDIILPHWLERKAIAGKLTEEPNSDEIGKQINLRSVIEFYSR